MSDLTVKKRMMFVKGDDFYFLTYNIILILDHLKCHSEEKRFRDYRKLPFLIDFTSNYYLNRILLRLEKNNLHISDKQDLSRSYSESLLRTKEVLKLLFTLEKKGYLTLSADTKNSQIDVFLNKEKLPDKFVNKDMFGIEIENLKVMRASIKKLSILKYDTLIQRIYFRDTLL